MKISGFEQIIVNQFAWVFNSQFCLKQIQIEMAEIKKETIVFFIRISLLFIVVFDQILGIRKFYRKYLFQ